MRGERNNHPIIWGYTVGTSSTPDPVIVETLRNSPKLSWPIIKEICFDAVLIHLVILIEII